MKLVDIMETLVTSIMKYGTPLPIFINPTPAELKQVLNHNVAKCVISSRNVYVFDWHKLSYDDLPKINGIRANLFFKGGDNLDIEVSSFNPDVKESDIESWIAENPFFKRYKVNKVHLPQEEKHV